MGRWTLRHTDEVLVTKLESIISGAIRRSRDESDGKTKPLMSYENFVESLDEEDSFTTTIIEILFRELDDRRTRPTEEDKRLISQQTYEGLHSLAVMSGTFRLRPYSRLRNRSTAHLQAAPGSLYTPADSEEDDFGVDDGMGGIEGARIDSALYDVYSGGSVGNPRGYPPAPAVGHTDDSSAIYRPYEGEAIPGRHLPLPQNHFIPANSRRWNSVFSSAGGGSGGINNSSSTNTTTLMRRHRPITRRVAMPPLTHASSEFSDFSTRMRSSHRQYLQTRDRANADDSQVPRGSSARLNEIQPSPVTLIQDLPRATLFDPPSPPGRDDGNRVPSPSPSTEEEMLSRHAVRPVQRPSRMFLHDPPVPDSDHGVQPVLGGSLHRWRDSSVPNAPMLPLRRGGVQPPETMLSQTNTDSLSRDVTMPPLLRPESEIDDGFERELRAEFDAWSGNDRTVLLDHQQEPLLSSVPSRDLQELQETPASLPTPRSVSPPNENSRPDLGLNGTAQ